MNYIKNNKNKKIIYVGLIIFVLILLIILLVTIFNNKEEKMYEQLDKDNANIVVSNEKVEKPGTFIRNIETLRKEHCKDDICINNMRIYYIKDNGRIEYEITNNSKKKVSGAFKLKFDNGITTYVIFNKLKKKETREGVITFNSTDFSNVYDYSLIKVKDDELKKLLNSKK